MHIVESVAVDRDDLTTKIAVPFKEGSTQTSTLLLSVNPYRFQATIYNDSTAALFVHYGPPVSTDTGGTHDVWEVQLAANEYYETVKGYVGPISVVWAAVNGFARGVEFVIDV